MRDLREIDVCAASVALTLVFFLAGGANLANLAVGNFSVALQEAAVYLVPTITVLDLENTYKAAPSVPLADAPVGNTTLLERPLRILIVPGHEPNYGGTEFQKIKERDIVVGIAEKLAGFLSRNPRYEVMVARDKNAWHPVLTDFFTVRLEDIKIFREAQRALTRGYFQSGSVLPAVDQVDHNRASDFTSLHLYGINKWTSENKYDITLHLHINDYPRQYEGTSGKHVGFSIYIQDHQFANGAVSRAIGEAIAARLNAYHATSTLAVESAGVLEDQELIAVGSNNSVDNASVLVEYGYIYEPQFVDADTRSLAETDYAYETYLGLQDFFEDPVLPTYGSGALPYKENFVLKGDTSAAVYSLQSALRYLGFYPPEGEEFSDCPISGHFGPCTERALKAFQTANGIEPIGTLGPKTRAALKSALVP